MTPHEWQTTLDIRAMLHHARGRTDRRRLRLFACGCCRQVWNPFIDPFTVGVVSAAEAFADGTLSEPAFARVREAANAAVVAAERAHDLPAYLVHVARAAAHACADDIAQHVLSACLAARYAVADIPIQSVADEDSISAEYRAETAAQADLLRDILGPDPASYRGAAEPAWLTTDVLGLARGIYANRDFGTLPILADALQEAGCDDDEVLDHCREPREHVRGCWVVDLLLERALPLSPPPPIGYAPPTHTPRRNPRCPSPPGAMCCSALPPPPPCW